MNSMKKERVCAVILLFFISWVVYGDVPEITLDTEVIIEYPFKFPINRTACGNRIYFSNKWDSGWGIMEIDIENRTSDIIDSNTAFTMFKGKYNNDLLVSRYNYDDRRESFFIYNPVNDEYTSIPGLDIDWNKRLSGLEPCFVDSIFYFENNQYIINLKDDSEVKLHFVYQFNSETGELAPLAKKDGHATDISPDKMHLLIANNGGGVDLYNIEQGKVVVTLQGGYNFRFDEACYFISNDYIAKKAYNAYSIDIYNLQGEKIVNVKIDPPVSGIYYANDFETIQYSEYYIFDIVEERTVINRHICKGESKLAALDSLGLLFHPTTGTVNDNRVRVREWPLLDAKHLGFLNEGDELEILDRSGIQVTIDDMTAYWYKVRRTSDGLEGWSYGYFIDLAEE